LPLLLSGLKSEINVSPSSSGVALRNKALVLPLIAAMKSAVFFEA
jgi:hypothetical protein